MSIDVTDSAEVINEFEMTTGALKKESWLDFD